MRRTFLPRRFDALTQPRQQRMGAGAVYTSDEEVLARANVFDANLRSFDREVDENPVFGKLGWTKFTDTAKRSSHEKFAAALADLDFDWFGTLDEGGKDDGYYVKLKKMTFLGAAEMSTVVAYEGRLAGLREVYAKLGYKTLVKPIAPPEETDQAGKWLKIAGIAVAVVAVAYVASTTLPLVSALAAKAAV